MTQTSAKKSLYDRDFNLWVEDTLMKLKSRRFDELDLENVVAEIEALTRRDKRELRSCLQVLLGHLLKRQFVNFEEDFRGWENTIRDQRSQISQILEDSPSLNSYLLENLDSAWQKALAEVQEDYPAAKFPVESPFPADSDLLLTQKFWAAPHT